jgi:hypothetical protein
MKMEIFCAFSLLVSGLALSAEPEGTVPKGQMLSDLYWNHFANDQLHAGGIPETTGSVAPSTDIAYDLPVDPNAPETISLKIVYSGSGPLQLKLLPSGVYSQLGSLPYSVTTHHYAITGEVRYEHVSAGSYLEAWSHFFAPPPKYPGEPGSPFPGEAFVTRGLADRGPMGKLEDTSDWREFWLPFDSTDAKTRLESMELNLHLGGPGTVHLRDLKLVQYPDNTSTPVAAPLPTLPAPSAKNPTQTFPGKEMYDFGWPDWFRDLPHAPKMQVDPEGSELALTYWGETPADLEVQRVEANVLSQMETNQFAIEGNIRYTKAAPGSYLEMWCYFTPAKQGDPQIAYVTRTLADSGLMARLDGGAGDSNTTDYKAMFRRFQIPFDITGAKTHLQRIIFKLHLTGGYGTTLQFDSVKFVQYPNGTFPLSVASVSTLPPTPVPPPPSKSPAPPGLSVIADLPIEKYLSSDQDQGDLLANYTTHDAA